ncbi:hypothetical protein A3I27_00965 [Candidatus Giovannonibacteria bacterium RIFCSPLOWO2_02_FULL_43_11b]|uniref:LTD domain-containing protein n=1 Tax=Candidatus Giovannonibacteria bacterium RIFCSPHIGHO2_12_FULL_43_15 TaxID=1798341 RepID=A0A1F5WQM6_9BACT|nr:MAG: hypothetical protein A2739_01170 [Candidatus Giovannonibacteria bacterium RIFCSPHIGHO2_01_FULL_43_100]OGF66775.1 MAG: hypothetical protein A3B97_02580 [Candidatus Giovannonibacteria bacterium RIFCSPHIGHO2_02_FULL_43_32]OGF77551.1 MAG: hypothetical protein A3F23_01075 [Candidatus Giovannonibacteria bacterium RIFCSPHIGHO2_12_FULL_43_15]OGF79012.1 MAG: hypothetical protein A3A15_00700 [Candidatus Giovannonibacteria bacterium RIFCSPLOWO2_01_FULL_43_60]OGF90374.1 MAG: hypothetical protein A3
MAEKRGEGGGGGGGSDAGILLFAVVLIAALFSSRGNSSGLFGNSGIKFGSPSGSGSVEEEISGTSGSSGIGQPQPVTPPSPVSPPSQIGSSISATVSTQATKDNITLQAFGSTRLGYAEEYVQLSAPSSNRGKVIITGLILKNKNNESVRIGSDEFGNSIVLNPGERAIISTAPSPRGFNFKLNKCSGYLAQSKTYSPSISSFCPHISDLPQVRDLPEKCEKYLDSLPYCTTPIINFQTGIDNKCANFIGEHASYPGCINDFKNDSDFDYKEWRIYLGLSREFWDNRHEDVLLLSQSRDLIAESSY